MNVIRPDFYQPLLALDTSTPACSVALKIGDEIFAESDAGHCKHTQVILPLIEKCLKNANIAVCDLGAIIVSAGPGAFTGLRVGAAVASALAVGIEVPLGSLSSLMLLAAGVKVVKETRVLALLDARIDQCYAGFYAVGKEEISILGDDLLLRPENLPINWLSTAEVAVGSGVVYRERFPVNFFSEAVERLPDARDVFRCLSYVDWQNCWAPLELRYLRNEVTQS